MDPHGLYSSVCAVMMVCLLGATRLSSGDNCKCPEIPPKDLTVREDGCFNRTYRYQCIPGYTRKPGASNLIKCQEKNGVPQWTETLFKCITDPNYEPPPTTTEFQPHPTISMDPSGPSSTSKPSASPNTERSTLGPSSTFQSVRTSTSSPSPSAHTLGRNDEVQKKKTESRLKSEAGERTTVCFSLIGVVLLVVVCLVIFFLHRQRNRPIPLKDPQELEALKC